MDYNTKKVEIDVSDIVDNKFIDEQLKKIDPNITYDEHGITYSCPNDPVNHPAHYTQGGIECIDAIEAACTGLDGQEGYLVGQVIKYIWRWKHKNGLQDLEKAKWYLERLIAIISKPCE